MEFKWMIVVLLQTTFTTVICSRMAIRETNFQKNLAIISIQSEDGDIIDCIDIYKQPAFDHPALRNHKIQMNPSYNIKTETTTDDDNQIAIVTTQRWHKSGSCPKGTIPIRRIQNNNVTKGYKDINYGRKKATSFHYDDQLSDSKRLYLLQKNHSYAILIGVGSAFYGAKGNMKVCNPRVESDDEYSTAQVTLKSGIHYDYEAMESGWAVNPSVYGDRQTRLFVYWTVDAAKKTGCFDLTCPGFVQTSNEIALGAAIYPISIPMDLPYEIIIFIHKDPMTNNWWVQYNERINIGYWPGDVFDRVKYHAEIAQWGGEVYSSRVGTRPHTSTAMGSGQLPDYILQTSGYVKRMRVLQNNHILRVPQYVDTYFDEWNCYQTFLLHDYVPEPEFYFGGPGSYRNPICR